MKNWFNKNYKTLIITAFLIPILIVAVVSISHVTQWYGISNPISWSVYLSIGIEVAALSALAAISVNMGSKVYFPFAIVTIIQFIGNVFFAYTYINIDSKQFKDWVDLVSPFVEFMGVESTDYVGHKRFLSFFAGGMLPIISLSFLHMLVKFTEENKKNEEKLVSDNNFIRESIKKEQEIDNPEGLKQFVDESTRIRLNNEDLKILENALLNIQKTNDNLKESIETQKEDLIEIIKNDVELGLYDKPFYNQLIKEEPSVILQNVSEMMLTTNSDIIESIPSDLDETLLDDYLEEENSQEEPIIEEEIQNFSTIEDIQENNPQEESNSDYQIPEQDGWKEEMEQKFWDEQVPEPFATPEEVEKFKIDSQTIENSINVETIPIDEEVEKFDVDLQDEQTLTEENKPSFEVMYEKKNS